MICRDSVGLHDLCSKLSVGVNAHADVFRTGFLGFSCKADIRDAALRIFDTPEIDDDVISF